MCNIFDPKNGKLIVFIDSHERKMVDLLKHSIDMLDFKASVVETTMKVGDILFTWTYDCECKIHTKDCPELKYKERFFNPTLENLAEKEQQTFKNKIIVPICAIERKECADFISSIVSTPSTPGFNRMKDQKERLKSFVQTTGCQQYIVVEGYHSYYYNSKGQQRMPKPNFDSALLSYQMKGNVKIHHVDSMLDSVLVVDTFCKKIKENGMVNNKFMYVFKKIVENWKTGIYAPEMKENWQTKYEILGKETEFSEYDTIIQTKKNTKDHSQLVSINKTKNTTPRIRTQMMLSCLPGVSEKSAKAIMGQYETLPALVKAYEKEPSEKKRRHMLEDLQMTNDDTGKKRKLGPKLSEEVYKTLFNIEEEEEKVEKNKLTKYFSLDLS